MYSPVRFHYLFCENAEMAITLLRRKPGLQDTAKGALFCYAFLSVIFSLICGCLKTFFQQQRLINVEYGNDRECMQRCFDVEYIYDFV